MSAAAALALPAAAELRLPPSVDPGQAVPLEIVPPAGAGAELLARPITGPDGGEVPTGPAVPLGGVEPGAGRIEFTAPARSGSYWLELHQNGRMRERADLEVVAAPVGLWTPSEVHPTAAFDIRLSIGGARDVLLVVENEAGGLVWERLVTRDEVGGGRLAIRAPDLSGRYLLQVLHGQNGTVLASRHFTVDAGKAWFRAPSVIAPGEPVRIDRFGPGGEGHALVITSEASGEVVHEENLAGSAGARDTVVLPGPRREGRYRLRYVSLADGAVLADVVLIVND
ncbi:hypothetical protein LNKW23_28050 [Paralimibaculum aggregatum]|uniref:DUF4198 domain-containing protein n=1 Tax=Paralimibaculum aggregatum TaxID=3036245 RepID=A0ABQ6LKT4_9RHOB|nr:hypothetical protein LNKW23_28050 [Limibaculum sp. NKW23]